MADQSNQYRLDFGAMQNSKLFHKFMKEKAGLAMKASGNAPQNNEHQNVVQKNSEQQKDASHEHRQMQDQYSHNEKLITQPQDSKDYQSIVHNLNDSRNSHSNGARSRNNSYQNLQKETLGNSDQIKEERHLASSKRGDKKRYIEVFSNTKRDQAAEESPSTEVRNFHFDSENGTNQIQANSRQRGDQLREQIDLKPKPKRQRNFGSRQQIRQEGQVSEMNSEKSAQYQLDTEFRTDPRELEGRKTENLAQNQVPTRSYNRHQVSNEPHTAHLRQKSEDDEVMRVKFQKLHGKYEELKRQLQNENRQRKREKNETEHQTEILKEKLFAVQSREDSLIMENQRLKDKVEYEVSLRTRAQEESKQLEFQVQKLEGEITMREGSVKQRSDDTQHWKAEAEAMREDLHDLRISYEKKCDEFSMAVGELQIVKRERDNKNLLLEDLRSNIQSLVEENATAKDEIFNLTTKLYQMHQEMQVLKADLKRERESSNSNYIRDKVNSALKDPIVSSPSRGVAASHQAQERPSLVSQRLQHDFVDKSRQTNAQKPARRRGEFARERGMASKHEKPESSFAKNLNQSFEQVPVRGERNTTTQSFEHDRSLVGKKSVDRDRSSKQQRLEEISAQIQKIKDMKAMTGKLRRQKIELEREFSEIEESLKSNS